jgi:arylsulfatase A-like enzyme
MKQKSLLLVTVDCLRADHVGFLGYSRPTTPFLDDLAGESFVVPSAVATGAPTYFSFPGIMASRYPLSLGRDVIGIAPQEPTLASVLKQAGYATGAFLAANPYLSPRFGYEQGFDTFHDFLDAELPGDHHAGTASRLTLLNQVLEKTLAHTRWTRAAYNELYFRYCQWRSFRQPVTMDQLRRYPSADVVIDQAVSWLSALDQHPFFLWLHLMDPHHPYYPPEEALSALACPGISARRAGFLNAFWNRSDVRVPRLQRYRDQILALYDAGIRWVDQQLSRLVRVLQDSDRWEDLIFGVTADHGEEFLEHGNRYHSPVALWKELVDVPLLIRVPGRRGSRLPPSPFSLIHLAPTLLEMLGIPAQPGFQGRGCWQEMKAGILPDVPAMIECVEGCTNPFRSEDRVRPRLLAVRYGSYKLVNNFTQRSESLYDLASDPGERTPLPPDAARAERQQLLEFARSHLRGTIRNRDRDLRWRARFSEFRCTLSLQSVRTGLSP